LQQIETDGSWKRSASHRGEDVLFYSGDHEREMSFKEVSVEHDNITDIATYRDSVEVLHGFPPGRRASEMKLEVECYSGQKADERPVRFRLDGHEYLVEEVLDQWYGSQDIFFKVRADDGNLYILRQETSTPDGPWHLESFRQLPGG
jgi:hypothetical protein